MENDLLDKLSNISSNIRQTTSNILSHINHKNNDGISADILNESAKKYLISIFSEGRPDNDLDISEISSSPDRSINDNYY